MPGYFSLVTAFILLGAVSLWVLIQRGQKWIVKGCLILCVVWFALAVYSAVPSFFGWPADAELPEGEVLAYRVLEPQNGPGAIYVWLAPREKPTKYELISRVLNPQTALKYWGTGEPRAYKLPYSKKQHQELAELQRQLEGQEGAFLEYGMEAEIGNISEDRSKSPMEFKILNPIEMLAKER